MAKKTLLFDDIDNSHEDVETVTFSLMGVNYTIDLSAAHRKELFDFMHPYAAAATEIPATDKKSRSAATEKLARVRAWANENGYDIASRGRIPAVVREAYIEANPDDAQ